MIKKIYVFAAALVMAAPLYAQQSALSQLGAASPSGKIEIQPLPAPSPAVDKEATSGSAAMQMWKALDFVSKVEEADFHEISGEKDVLAASSVSCVDENYTACSMYVHVAGQKKLLVTLDAGEKMIRAFYANGFEFDEETGILYAESVTCSKTGETYSCELVPYDKPADISKASPGKGTQLVLDPATGRTEVVIPVGGGFIYASTGKFQQAVYNGSGYILPDGKYLPVIGGKKAEKPSDLTGKWLGWGDWTYHGSETGAHCYMTLEFQDGTDSLYRKGGYFDCGVAGLASEPAMFVKKGTQLLDQAGNPAGSYENGVVTLREAYDYGVSILTTIKVSGLHMDYSEIWTEKNGSVLYNITGRLFTDK